MSNRDTEELTAVQIEQNKQKAVSRMKRQTKKQKEELLSKRLYDILSVRPECATDNSVVEDMLAFSFIEGDRNVEKSANLKKAIARIEQEIRLLSKYIRILPRGEINEVLRAQPDVFDGYQSLGDCRWSTLVQVSDSYETEAKFASLVLSDLWYRCAVRDSWLHGVTKLQFPSRYAMHLELYGFKI